MIYRICTIVLALLLTGSTLSQTSPSEQDPLHTLRHEGVITEAAWSSDGTQIAVASEDNSLRVWDASSGEELLRHDSDSPARGVLWSDDGLTVVFWTDDGTVQYLNTESGEISEPLPRGDSPPVRGIRWLDAGESIIIWDADGITSARLSQPGWASGDISLPHDSPVTQADLNDDASHIYTFTEAGTARIWETASGDLLETLETGQNVRGVTWNKDESQYIAWGLAGVAALIDLETQNRYDLRHRTFYNGARFNQDDTRVMTWSADDTVKVWDTSTGEELLTLTHNDWVEGATWNADETRIVSWAFDSAWLWDAESGDLLARFTHDNIVNGAAFHPSEERLLAWGWDGAVQIWDIADLMPE